MKLRLVSKIVIQQKQEEGVVGSGGVEQQERLNTLFYDKVRGVVMGSENQRLCALLELKKDMLKDYKVKYERNAKELYELKLKVNVR